MSAGAILEDLERLGVELRVIDGALEYEGPEEAITPELLDTLQRYKTELIRLLTGDHNPRLTVGSDPAARELRAAGWKHKERCGKTIWQHPHNGFYYSHEVALLFLLGTTGEGVVSSSSAHYGKGTS